PKQRFSTDLVSANPIEWFLLDIGMFVVLHEEVLSVFAECVTPADNWIRCPHFFGDFTAVFELPRHHVSSRIVDIVFYITAAFEYNTFEAAFGEFLCRPPAADAGSYNDRIECTGLNVVDIEICHYEIVLAS